MATDNKTALRPGELFFSVFLTGFSAVALWQAYEISGFQGLATPGIFPMLAAGTMLVSGLFILADSISRRRVADGDQQVAVLTSRLVITVLLVTAYVFVMPYLGFMVSSTIFLFAAFAYLWRRSALISVILTAGTLVAIYLIFRILFQVVLPRGSLMQGIF